MGAQYIPSAVIILNAEALELKLEKSFDSIQSPYEIYLYKL